jgi:hypothetical protein
VPAQQRSTKRKRADTSKKDGESKANKTDATSFSTMAQIVDFMKKRHLANNVWGLKLEEILDEMGQESLPTKVIVWLNQSLPDNPRLTAQTEEGTGVVKYVYKPPHRIRSRNEMGKLLKKYHTDGKGALLQTELNDCIANAGKIMESLGSQVISVPTNVSSFITGCGNIFVVFPGQ